MIKRAKELAIKAYPNVEQPVWDESYPKTLFVRHTERLAFIKGYEQAEKDLALTWEDIKYIVQTFHHIICDTKNITSDEGYVKTLQIFNEQRENNGKRKEIHH